MSVDSRDVDRRPEAQRRRGKPPRVPSQNSVSSSSNSSIGSANFSNFDEHFRDGATSQSLNKHDPYAPNADINTPLQPSQHSTSHQFRQPHSNHSRYNADLRRPSDSSEESELRPQNLEHSLRRSYDRSREFRGNISSAPRSEFLPTHFSNPTFDARRVMDDIALPTVESILAQTKAAGSVGSYAVPPSQSSVLGNPASLGGFAVPPQTTRNTVMPSFEDINVAHQRSYLAHAPNSIAASPSLVSALHALQKHCQRLKEQNDALTEQRETDRSTNARLQGTSHLVLSTKPLIDPVSITFVIDCCQIELRSWKTHSLQQGLTLKTPSTK